jgi:hypothetical protein
LGGYDAIAAVVDDLLPRLRQDSLLGRFWTSPRSVDTNDRERQLAIDFIAAAAGGPTIYLGRDMKLAHTGMGIGKADYAAFIGHSRYVQSTPNPSAAKSSPSPSAWKQKSPKHNDTSCRPARNRRIEVKWRAPAQLYGTVVWVVGHPQNGRRRTRNCCARKPS